MSEATPSPTASTEPSAPIEPAAPIEPRPSSGRFRRIALLALVAGCAATVGLLVPTQDATSGAVINRRPIAASASPAAPDLVQEVKKSLDVQAAALLRGDEKGWLAAVDAKRPAVRKHYQELYRSLRALRVSHFAFHPVSVIPQGGDHLVAEVQLAFCFSMPSCPNHEYWGYDGAMRIMQKVSLRRTGDGHAITAIGKAESPNRKQPTPWEAGGLTYAQGRRVTVAAPRQLAPRLKEALAEAEKAAAVTDRFSARLKNPQRHYRIFLATDSLWRTWYGGERANYAIGYAMPLNRSGTDVVLQMSRISDRQELRAVLQHEMAHVVTFAARSGLPNEHDWLTEGFAEYVAFLPRNLTGNWYLPVIRSAVRGSKAPKSVVQPPLTDSSTDAAADRFYGYGEYAVNCMVKKYGERKTVEFVRLVLHDGKTLDAASRRAYGKPFATVDKGCVSWIRNQAG